MDSRDAVAEVMEKLSSEPEQAEAAEPVADTPEAPETAAAGTVDAEPAAPARGPDGKFAKGGKPKTLARESAVAGALDTPQAAPVAPPASVLPEIKAPQELKAAIKEKWSSFPREVQEALSESYLHKQKVMSETAQSRKAAEEWQQTVAPFAHAFNGAPPHQVVGSLLRAWGTLNTGHPQERAQVIAEIIRGRLGSDEAALRMLASALDSGGTAPAPAPQPQGLRESDLEGWYAKRQQAEQQGRAIKAWQDFEGSQPEFLNSGDGPAVRRAMTVMVTNWQADNAGQQPTSDVFKTLYEEACRAVPAVRAVIDQRAAAIKTPSSPPAAAAVGIKHEAAGPSGATGPARNTAEEVRRQIARISGRARV